MASESPLLTVGLGMPGRAENRLVTAVQGEYDGRIHPRNGLRRRMPGSVEVVGMPSILFVCSANQCRSPMAAALFLDLLEREGLGADWQVESAGTWAEEGFPATADARRAMQERGIDLSRHRSQTVTAEVLDRADLVLVMETAHLRTLQSQFPPRADRIHLLTEMIGESHDVEDPVGMGLERYRSLADDLQALFSRALPRIQRIVSP